MNRLIVNTLENINTVEIQPTFIQSFPHPTPSQEVVTACVVPLPPSVCVCVCVCVCVSAHACTFMHIKVHKVIHCFE